MRFYFRLKQYLLMLIAYQCWELLVFGRTSLNGKEFYPTEDRCVRPLSHTAAAVTKAESFSLCAVLTHFKFLSFSTC